MRTHTHRYGLLLLALLIPEPGFSRWPASLP